MKKKRYLNYSYFFILKLIKKIYKKIYKKTNIIKICIYICIKKKIKNKKKEKINASRMQQLGTINGKLKHHGGFDIQNGYPLLTLTWGEGRKRLLLNTQKTNSTKKR